MGELGADAPRLHEELGEYARNAGVDQLLTLGEHAALAARAFGSGGQHFTRMEELVSALRAALGKNVTVLVKGSRFMKMERVVDAIAADAAGGTACS
jgi:UDP-N-acetylmuramoyl-tripeptide--D-alanyl-D-alanine ligase